MNLRDEQPSANYADRTGWSPTRQTANTITTMLNPLLAARNLRSWMRANGYAPMRPEIRLPSITDVLKGE